MSERYIPEKNQITKNQVIHIKILVRLKGHHQANVKAVVEITGGKTVNSEMRNAIIILAKSTFRKCAVKIPLKIGVRKAVKTSDQIQTRYGETSTVTIEQGTSLTLVTIMSTM